MPLRRKQTTQPDDELTPDQPKGSTWTDEEKVQLCESWRVVCHCPITGVDQTVIQMWKKIRAHFAANLPGTERTSGALASQWRELTKEFTRWKEALRHGRENTGSGYSMEDEIKHAQLWYSLGGKSKTFTNLRCWDVVKDCPKWKIITDNSQFDPMDAFPTEGTPIQVSSGVSPIEEDLADDTDPTSDPIPEPTSAMRPQGRKAAKAKKKQSPMLSGSLLETVTRNAALRIEESRIREQRRIAEREEDNAMIQREIEEKAERRRQKEERQVMAMDTSNMSPDTKEFWRQERRDIIARRRLFRDGGSSSNVGGSGTNVARSSSNVQDTDWFGDGHL